MKTSVDVKLKEYNLELLEKDYDRIIKTIYEEEGPSLVVAKCQAKATPLVFPHSFDGSVSINRFMSTLKS